MAKVLTDLSEGALTPGPVRIIAAGTWIHTGDHQKVSRQNNCLLQPVQANLTFFQRLAESFQC